jgi:hypothetical protein
VAVVLPQTSSSALRRAAQAAAVATQLAVSAGVRAQRVEHAITHMKRTRSDLVINGTARAPSVRELVEAKTCAFCSGNYDTRFATNGSTWMEARAHKTVKQRDGTTAALDNAVFAGVPSSPIATQAQKMGGIVLASGITAVVLGGFCEHNDQVHRLVDMFAATGLGQKRRRRQADLRPRLKQTSGCRLHRTRLRICGWRRGQAHGAVTTDLFTHAARPLSTPAPTTHRSR